MKNYFALSQKINLKLTKKGNPLLGIPLEIV